MGTSPNCLYGYAQDAAITAYTVCKKGVDEVVKVGFGVSAFWMDRYEASGWIQAARACRASGKWLPTHDEWLEAAAGTPDPGSSTGSAGTCAHSSPPAPARAAPIPDTCQGASAAGAVGVRHG